MSNPWLDIPDVDYIGHMSSPAVNQWSVLNQLLRDALESGLEHVDVAVTSRVTGVDLNATYLRRLVERFSNPRAVRL